MTRSKSTKHPNRNRPSRRNFNQTALAGAAAIFAAPAVLPAGTRESMLNSKLRTAHIGVGGMGNSDLNSIASHQDIEVVALVDVDEQRLGEAAKSQPRAEKFADFRKMFDRLAGQIDAVVVSTPDHTHAAAAMMAMQLDKHVYCQKPLTHEVHESRRLREVASERKLVTQMGIQIHSAAPYRRAAAIIQDGAIGKVSQVHAWSNKNWGYDGPAFDRSDAPPATLDWDLWLGTAGQRDFVNNAYHPGNWRKLIDFGTGTLGDMGVHIFDTPYDALQLTAPNWVQTFCRQPTGVGHPEQNRVVYEFPGTRYTTDKMVWTWYDGGMAPPRGAEQMEQLNLPADTQLPGQGSLFVGEKGSLLLPHIAEPKLFPVDDFADYRPPEVQGSDHYHQWVDACLGTGQASAPFEFGGPLTEALLLGVVANRFPEQKLEWDAENMRITNLDEANGLLKRDYRQGFGVEGL